MLRTLAILCVLALAPLARASGPVAGIGLVSAVSTGSGAATAWGGQVTAGWAFSSIDGSKLLTPRFRFRGFPAGPRSLGGGVQLFYSPATDDPTGYFAVAADLSRWDRCIDARWCGNAFEAEVEGGARLPLERGRSAFLGLSCAAQVRRPVVLVLPALVGGFTF